MNTHYVTLALAALALTLVACAGTSPSSSQTQPQSVVTTPPPEGSVPAGSRMMVRMTQPLNSGRQGAGTRFTATLEANLVGTDGEVVAWLEAKGIEILPVDFRATMELGCNVVSLGDSRVLSTADSTGLNSKLRALGFEVFDPDMSMFTNAGGGVHCMAQHLRRDPG